jgi:U-box domain
VQHGEAQHDVQSDADVCATEPSGADGEADNSWQLCPLSKVSNMGRGAAYGSEPLISPFSRSNPRRYPGEIATCMLQARMKDPVIASDGICYERAAIEEWVAQHGSVSPMTSEAIKAELIPNHSLRSLLQSLQWRSLSMALLCTAASRRGCVLPHLLKLGCNTKTACQNGTFPNIHNWVDRTASIRGLQAMQESEVTKPAWLPCWRTHSRAAKCASAVTSEHDHAVHACIDSTAHSLSIAHRRTAAVVVRPTPSQRSDHLFLCSTDWVHVQAHVFLQLTALVLPPQRSHAAALLTALKGWTAASLWCLHALRQIAAVPAHIAAECTSHYPCMIVTCMLGRNAVRCSKVCIAMQCGRNLFLGQCGTVLHRCATACHLRC